MFDYTADGAGDDGRDPAVGVAGQARRAVCCSAQLPTRPTGSSAARSARPAIVVVTFEGERIQEPPARPRTCWQRLERSRAALHVVAVGTPTLRRMNRARVESGDAQGDEWTVDENNRNAVLGEGLELSGGRRHELAVASGLSQGPRPGGR